MSEEVARQFIDALNRLETNRDLETIVEMFADNSSVGNVVMSEPFTGREGARKFWENYRNTFGEVKSTFRNVIATRDHAALEWTTEGTGQDGSPVKYDGVSILEMEGDQIKRFNAYFDSREISQQVVKEAKA